MLLSCAQKPFLFSFIQLFNGSKIPPLPGVCTWQKIGGILNQKNTLRTNFPPPGLGSKGWLSYEMEQSISVPIPSDVVCSSAHQNKWVHAPLDPVTLYARFSFFFSNIWLLERIMDGFSWNLLCAACFCSILNALLWESAYLLPHFRFNLRGTQSEENNRTAEFRHSSTLGRQIAGDVQCLPRPSLADVMWCARAW